MRAVLVLIGLGLLVSAPIGSADAEDAPTKRDRQGPVTVAVTLLTPPPSGAPVTVRVVLDTRSVSLDGVAFERAVTLQNLDGRDEAPSAVERVTGTGHHREAVVVFRVLQGTTDVQIVVKDVGGIFERMFAW